MNTNCSVSGKPLGKHLHKLLSIVLTLCLASVAWSDENGDSGSGKPQPEKTVSEKSPKTYSAKETQKFSDRIDQLISRHLSKSKQKIRPRSSDEVFLRRVYLGVVGRIPNIDEARDFLESKDQNKRGQLVDELMESYGYVSDQFNFWADLLRIRSRGNKIVGQPYIDFVKDSIESNKPYDEFVWQLLASEGALFEKGNGAVGYYLRDADMPEDNMSNTVRVFLGTRLECAQCHDHPFDKWTQRQYFEMVGFTGGMRYQVKNGFAKDLSKIRNNDDLDFKSATAARRILNLARSGIEGNGTGLARLPEDFKGTDGKSSEVIPAKTMFKGTALVDANVPAAESKKKKPKRKKNQLIKGARQIDSRKAYATWLTEADNPRFAKVIANRLWKRAFGIGLIEPVDVIEESTVASNPKLMKFLTELMIEIDFDLKQFNRIIYNTRAWQAQVATSDVTEPHKYGFAGPVLRRMSAEQLWDSILGLTVSEVDVRSSNPVSIPALGSVDIYQFTSEIRNMSAMEVYEKILADSKRKNKRKSSSQYSQGSQQKARNQKQEVKKQLNELNQLIKKAKKKGDNKKVRELMIERVDFVSHSRGGNEKYRRASELPSPAPAKHFLREFGQSDRETIENANTDPAVTQVLRLMNGFVDNSIGKDPNTVLVGNVLESDGPRDSVETIYLTLLSRQPTSKELAIWMPDFNKAPKLAFADLIWTLINSNEFIFVR